MMDDRTDTEVIIEQLNGIAEMMEEAMQAFQDANDRFGAVLISIGHEMTKEIEDDDAS